MNIGAPAAAYADQLVELLCNPVDHPVSEKTIESLAAMGELLVPRVAALLVDPRDDVRKAAAATLGHMGPGAAPYAAELAELLHAAPCGEGLDCRNWDLQWVAAKALGAIGEASASHAGDCATLLQKMSSHGRGAKTAGTWGIVAVELCKVMVKMGHTAALTHLSAIVDVLCSPHVSRTMALREAASTIIAEFGLDAISHVVKALGHEDSSVRLLAITTFQKLGEVAFTHVADVVMLLLDGTQEAAVYKVVESILFDVGEPVVPLLEALLDNPSCNSSGQKSAIRSLCTIKMELGPGLLSHPNKDVREGCMRELLRMRKAESFTQEIVQLLMPHTPKLLRSIFDADKNVRSETLRALRSIQRQSIHSPLCPSDAESLSFKLEACRQEMKATNAALYRTYEVDAIIQGLLRVCRKWQGSQQAE